MIPYVIGLDFKLQQLIFAVSVLPYTSKSQTFISIRELCHFFSSQK